MIRAGYKDKDLIVDILARSFNDNKSVNYIIRQDVKREQRIRRLMEYSFDVCYMFGDVFLSNDKAGCALIVMPDKKKTTIKSIIADVKFIMSRIGLSNIKKAMDREAKIKKHHPESSMYYLWFISVDPVKQNNGTGSSLLKDVVRQASLKNRSVYLETSVLKNIVWYEKHGFKTYKELDLGYKLFFLRNEE
jgi:hypothetical protein